MKCDIAIIPFVLAAALAVQAEEAAQPALSPLPDSIPFPQANPPAPAKIHLGQQLFFDPRLSGDNTTSCATCHIPEKGYADGRAKSPGFGGKPLKRNTQGLANVALYSSFFWDGRARSLEEQALAPIQSPEEMNQDLDELERELNAVEGYRRQFRAVFGSGVTRDGIAKALAAFQRTLVARDSPLDRYLAGDDDALSDAAKRGLELFTGDAGCIRCHHGPLLSDERYYRIGASWHDRGRSLVTGKKEDDYRFRTPSLRNIAETAPYMHDGSLATLGDVVSFYFRGVPAATPDGRSLDVQPRVDSSFSDIDNLVAFLRSLTGKLPEVAAPELP